MEDREEESTTRRRFVWLSGFGALGATAAGGAVVLADFVNPKVLFEPPTSFRVGKPDNFPVNSVTADYDRKVYVVRTEVGFFALSAVCTHLGCITRWVRRRVYRLPLPRQQVQPRWGRNPGPRPAFSAAHRHSAGGRGTGGGYGCGSGKGRDFTRLRRPGGIDL